MKVISLGWGVQSWTMAAMVALGDLPPVDFAVHSDTTWEREETYRFATEWAPWLDDHGVRVVTVDDREQAQMVMTSKTDAPFFTVSEKDGINGQLRRQCTGRWKITPIRRYIAAELKRLGLKKAPGIVEQWIGITLDEWHRAKDSDVKYVVHKFPLLDMNMTRQDCLTWLERHALPTPGKSACTFCPYHSLSAWREMKRQCGADWRQAVSVDAAIRNQRPPYPLFVHPARVPLEEAVSIPEDDGWEQNSLFAECDSGACFL